jgi:Uma2 family endonuclease
MLAIRSAIIDDTAKPAIEWINGTPVQKPMPTDLHGILQLAFATFLKASSPDDAKEDVATRQSFFLWWGVKLVLIADPVNRTVEAHEPSKPVRFFGEADIVTSSSFPSLAIPLREIFAELDEPADPSTGSG